MITPSGDGFNGRENLNGCRATIAGACGPRGAVFLEKNAVEEACGNDGPWSREAKDFSELRHGVFCIAGRDSVEINRIR